MTTRCILSSVSPSCKLKTLDLVSHRMRQLRPKLAGPSSGGGQLRDGEGGAHWATLSRHTVYLSVNVTYQFPRCDNGAEILATARYSWLIRSVWSDEWIRILCNDYFLATVISYTDYFEVIVTLDPITEYPPTTNLFILSLVALGLLSVGFSSNPPFVKLGKWIR